MDDVSASDIELYRGLEPVLGADVATKLLERLPSVPSSELATKTDLRELEGRIGARFDVLEQRFDEKLDLRLQSLEHKLTALFRGEMNELFHRQTRQMVFAIVGSMAGLSGVAWSVSTLAR